MRFISFAWTVPALLAGEKTVTRRDWKASHAQGFSRGELVSAYDKDPRAGGQKIGEIRLKVPPYLEPVSEMPASDYDLEGFAYFEDHPEELPSSAPPWMRGLTRENFTDDTGLYVDADRLFYPGAGARALYVVRFELVRTPA